MIITVTLYAIIGICTILLFFNTKYNIIILIMVIILIMAYLFYNPSIIDSFKKSPDKLYSFIRNKFTDNIPEYSSEDIDKKDKHIINPSLYNALNNNKTKSSPIVSTNKPSMSYTVLNNNKIKKSPIVPDITDQEYISTKNISYSSKKDNQPNYISNNIDNNSIDDTNKNKSVDAKINDTDYSINTSNTNITSINTSNSNKSYTTSKSIIKDKNITNNNDVSNKILPSTITLDNNDNTISELVAHINSINMQNNDDYLGNIDKIKEDINDGHTLSIIDGDETAAYLNMHRNEPTRVIIGMSQQYGNMSKYITDELDESDRNGDWWGLHEY